MTECSPRPWRIEEKSTCLSIKDAENFTVANITFGYNKAKNFARCMADALLIVNAVNGKVEQ